MFYKILSVILLVVVSFVAGVVAANHCPAVQKLSGCEKSCRSATDCICK